MRTKAEAVRTEYSAQSDSRGLPPSLLAQRQKGKGSPSVHGVRHLISIPHLDSHLIMSAWFISSGRTNGFAGDRDSAILSLGLMTVIW